MYYELYVDVLFLVNFMMDYLLLLIVKRALKCAVNHGNICVGALLGSFLTCVIVVIPIPYEVVKLILFHLFVNTCMIRVGLKINRIRSFVKAMIMLYIGGFLLGGILEALRQYVRFGSLFFAVALAGYYLVLGIWKFIGWVEQWNRCHCNVELFLGEKQYQVKGLIDTGNGLKDPLSGQPVSILDRKVAKELLEESTLDGIRYIPYQTIGKKGGVLPAIQVDKMCVHGENKYWVEAPLIGISEEEFSAEEYKMILNPNLF